MKRFLITLLPGFALLSFTSWLVAGLDIHYAAVRPGASLWLQLIEPYAEVALLVSIALVLLSLGFACGRIGRVRIPA